MHRLSLVLLIVQLHRREMAKIKSIEHFRVRPRWLFVKVCDDEGHFGWGEATLEGHTQAVEGSLDSLAERFTGYEARYGTFPGNCPLSSVWWKVFD